MVFPQNPGQRLLLLLVSRVVIFFFVMCLLTLLLYIAGTSQGFIDSTQLFLLRLLLIFGIFLSVSSFYGIIIDTGRFLGSKMMRYLLRAFWYLLLVVFGIVMALAAMFIITLSLGNGV